MIKREQMGLIGLKEIFEELKRTKRKFESEKRNDLLIGSQRLL